MTVNDIYQVLTELWEKAKVATGEELDLIVQEIEKIRTSGVFNDNE